MPGNGGGARISASPSPSPSPSPRPAARAVAKPPPAHYLHELPAQDEERLEGLFQRLDLDGNGRIDVHDLSQALREVGVHTQYAQYAQKFLAHSDRTKSGDISLAEFIHYVREHEKNLRLQFSHLDKNKDGKIDLEELIRAFKELGIEIARQDATELLQRMDQDGSLNISFNEWRDFLLYAPSSTLLDIIEYWHHTTSRTRTPSGRIVGSWLVFPLLLFYRLRPSYLSGTYSFPRPRGSVSTRLRIVRPRSFSYSIDRRRFLDRPISPSDTHRSDPRSKDTEKNEEGNSREFAQPQSA